MGRLQNEDFKSSAELVSAGGTAAQLLNDTKIYVTGNSINDTLFNAIQAGSIGGGGGSKNYITTGSTFENNATTGWSLSHTTLDSNKFPNQASGSWTSAAGTLAISTIGSGSQLAGNYSLSLASSAATTAGDMLVSNAITLDKEAQASVQTITCYYKVASGSPNFSGTSSNSLAAAIYDVTNSAWIQPAGVYNFVNTATVGKFTATFQVPANTTSVRLALYFPNSTAAVTFYLDDFSLGPAPTAVAPAMSDWISFTPTGTWTANVTYVGKYRRVGDSYEFDYSITCSGAPTSTTLTLQLPSGLSIDTTKLALSGNDNEQLGIGVATDTGVNSYPCVVNYVNTTTVKMLAMNAAGTYSLESAVTQAVPFTFGSTDTIQARFVAPIVGLSSNSVSSSDTDTRVISSKATLSATSGNFTTNVEAKVPLNSALSDPTGIFDSVNNRWNIAVTGDYFLSTVTNWSTQTGVKLTSYRVNGGSSQYFGMLPSGDRLPASTLIPGLKAGDYVEWWVRQDSGGNATLAAGSASTTASLFRLSGPAVITATESVNAAYGNGAGTSITNVSAVVPWPTKVFDSHAAMNVNGTYTVPVSGKYSVSATLLTASTSFAVANNLQLYLYKNGSSVNTLGYNYVLGTTRAWVTGNAMISCNAGDTIQVYMNVGSGSTTLSNSVTDNFIAIARVGN
jgi:hypothetical protein